MIGKLECPDNCPKCESNDISHCGDVTEICDSFIRFFTCEECDFKWSELFEFKNWSENK